jgi:hypothetical protein
MNPWFLIVIMIIVCITMLFFTQSKREDFEDLQVSPMQQGGFADMLTVSGSYNAFFANDPTALFKMMEEPPSRAELDEAELREQLKRAENNRLAGTKPGAPGRRLQERDTGSEFYRSHDFYTKGQRTTFHDLLPKGIPVNPGMMGGTSMVQDASGNTRIITGSTLRDARNMGTVTDALNQPDFGLPIGIDRDYNAYFQESDNPFTAADIEFCRNIAHPKDIKRAPRADVGCSWWFVEDQPNKPRTSTAALGRFKEPLDPDLKRQYPGGIWIWNLEEAIKMENIKRCKRVRNCAAMDAPGVKGNCAFCTELGHAIPVKSDGRPMYPEDQAGDCSDTLAFSSSQCQRNITELQKRIVEEAKKAALSSTGGSTIFEPEVDDDGNTIRTAEEVAAAAALSSNAATALLIRDVCDPDARGKLSPDCLIAIAGSVGLNDNGAIVYMIRNRMTPSTIDKAAIDVIRTRAGMQIPNAVLGDGGITKESAANAYASIFNLTTAGKTKMIREAAKWLCYGTEEFDMCDFESNDTGPFSVECLQRRFRMAGCQPSGNAAPTPSNASSFMGMTWNDIGASFEKLYLKMTSEKIKQQDPAVIDCLGTTIYRHPPVTVCMEPGIQYTVYAPIPNYSKGQYNAPLNQTNESNRTLYFGRFISKNGFLAMSYPVWGGSINTQLGNMLRNAANVNGSNNVIYRAVTYVTIKAERQAISGNWWHASQAYKIFLNGIEQPGRVVETWTVNTRTEWNIVLPFGRNKLEIVYNGPAVHNSIGQPRFGWLDDNPATCTLPDEPWKPFVALNFFTGKAEDAAENIQLGAPNSSYGSDNKPLIGEKDGRKCALLTPANRSNNIWFKTALHTGVVRSITCMFNTNARSNLSQLFSFFGFTLPTRKQYRIVTAFDGTYHENIVYTLFNEGIDKSNGLIQLPVNEFFGRSPHNKWVHVAIVMADDNYTAQIYINGKLRHTATNWSRTPMNHTAFLTDCCIAGSDFNGAMSWFHIYDRPLTANDIERDMNYNNPNYKTQEDIQEDIQLEPRKDRYGFKYGHGQNWLTDRPLAFVKNVSSAEDCAQRCENDPRCTKFSYNGRWGEWCSLSRYNTGEPVPLNQESWAYGYSVTGTVPDRKPDFQGACPSGMFEYGTNFGGKGFCCPVMPGRSTANVGDRNVCGDGRLSNTCSLDANIRNDGTGVKPMCPI